MSSDPGVGGTGALINVLPFVPQNFHPFLPGQRADQPVQKVEGGPDESLNPQSPSSDGWPKTHLEMPLPVMYTYTSSTLRSRPASRISRGTKNGRFTRTPPRRVATRSENEARSLFENSQPVRT